MTTENLEEDVRIENHLRPQLLEDYIGQAKAKETLKIYIEAAKSRGGALDHVLFYCEDIPQVLAECRRVLKNGGRFLCSTYGKQHMREITDLVQQFHKEIVLSAEVLYERFGLENGENLLAPYFPEIQMRRYEDAIEIAEAEPLISYILSCHGNQNQLLLNQYKEFREFVSARVADGFHITKDAGIFLCRK